MEWRRPASRAGGLKSIRRDAQSATALLREGLRRLRNRRIKRDTTLELIVNCLVEIVVSQKGAEFSVAQVNNPAVYAFIRV